MKKRLRKSKLLIGIGLLLIIIAIPGASRGVRYLWLKQPASGFPLKLQWEANLGHTTYERPAYKNGLILIPAESWFNSSWYGLDEMTGQVFWSRNTGKARGRYNFRRCLTDDYLVISGHLSLYVLEPQTGNMIWGGERADRYYANTATCTNEIVITGISRSYLQAFNLTEGQLIWTTSSANRNLSDPVYNPDTEQIIAYGPEGILNTISPHDGTLIRSFERSTAPPYEEWRGSMYVVDEGQLFLGGTVLDATTGEVLHKEDQYQTLVPPTLYGDTIYISSNREGIIALDRSSFKVKWIYQPQPKNSWFPLIALSQVAILDEVGYVIFSDATLRAFDIETGQALGYWQPPTMDLWNWPICMPPVVLGCNEVAKVGLATSDDTLFVSFGDGKLYAFRKSP